ncbi:hypothetical protein, partial [Xenorhabdus sp. KK7.4]|uniref:hypothetical protein n=1 Tax=Xenorhabdus sp. KK7.4 TaxID=1851572 RepID=UPI0019D4C3CC
ARCFNKSKGVFIAASSLKALRNPLPSRGFSIYKKPDDRHHQVKIIKSFSTVGGANPAQAKIGALNADF